MIIFILSLYVVLSLIYIVYLLIHKDDKKVEEEKRLFPCAIICDGMPKIIWLTEKDIDLEDKND